MLLKDDSHGEGGDGASRSLSPGVLKQVGAYERVTLNCDSHLYGCLRYLFGYPTADWRLRAQHSIKDGILCSAETQRRIVTPLRAGTDAGSQCANQVIAGFE